MTSHFEAEFMERYRRGDVCIARLERGVPCGRDRHPSPWREAPWPLCSHHLRQFDEWVELRMRGALEELAEAQAAEDARREAEREARSVVYFVSRDADGLVKIGFTSRLTARLGALRREHGDLRVLATESGGREREAALHAAFADYRVVGEWFQPHPALHRYIESIAAEEAA